MVGNDGSDILGGDKLPVGRYQPPSYWSTLSGVAKLALYSVTLLLSAIFLRTFYHRFLRWRETNYRKATRRRHGIPDTDNRPFNVAYAAAVTARKENEARKNLQLRQRTVEEASPAPSPARRSLCLDARQPLTSVPGGLGSYPIRSPSVVGRARSSLGPTYGQQSHMHPINTLTGRQDNISASSNRSNRSSPRKSSRPQTSSPLVHPQSLANEDDGSETEIFDHPVEENYSEGAPQSDEDYEMEVEAEGDIVPARGAKRLASSNDEDDFGDSFVTQRRDKRARKVSRDHPPIPEDDLMVDAEADAADESYTSPRGKKRDRGDAASTFGGDEDSLIDDSDDMHKRNRRRRTVSTRKPRGQKRGRESHTFESGSDGEVEFSSVRGSRKKRGKKAVAQDDPTSFEPPYSTDPLCKGRRVGEEWEIGGTKYKVGPNGDRLQQALVKRKRPKYKMPTDSQHPDKDVMIEVVVEAWLTEDEYKLAKEQFELAWQDPPTVDVEMETPSEPQTPVKGGKALLWSSTTSHADSPIPERRPFRQSLTTNVGLPLPPSPQIRAPGKGRISTPAYSPATVGLDSPRLKHVKSFSKWEKQDMEAEAMSKIRQKLQDQKKVTEDEKKPSQVPVPAVSFKPPTTASTTSTTTPSLFTLPSATSQSKPTTSTTTKPETREPAQNLFATPTPAPTPSVTVPVPAQPALPNFFAKPTPTTTPTSTTKPDPSATATSTTVPNFFSKPVTPAPPTTITSNPTAAPAPTFSFPTSKPTPVMTTGTTSSTTKSTFAFPSVGGTGPGPSLFAAPKPVEQPKEAQPTTTTTFANTPSFAARLGPQVANTPAPAPSTTKPTLAFNLPTTTSTTSASEPPKPADSTPKFSFGFTKPSTPATSTTSATSPGRTTTDSTTSQFGKTGQSQPAPSPFGATGQFQLTSSPFGNTGQSQPTPPFGVTGQSKPTTQSQATPSPFGITSQPTPLPFGTAGQPNPPTSGIQPTPSQPTPQPSQPPFNFAANKPVGGSDSWTTFPPSTSTTPGTSTGTHPFAAPKQDASRPGPSPLANGSVFGTTSTPVSAFGTTTTTTQSTPAPAMNKPTFPSTTTNGTTGSKPSAFVFTPVTPSTSTGGGTGSPFNFGASGPGQNGTTPAAFGFGPPAFTFGKPAEKK